MLVVQPGAGYVQGDEVATTVTIGDSSTGTIGGQVWNDADDDGVLDASEGGVSDVTVSLLDGGQVIRQAVTDATGAYEFTGLRPGSDYQVQFTPLADYDAEFSPSGADSAADPTTGITGSVAVAAGQVLQAISAGLVRANQAPPRGAPSAVISFPKDNNDYYLQITMTTQGNNTYSFGPQRILTQSGQDARAIVLAALTSLGWDAASTGNYMITVKGYWGANGVLDPVKTVDYAVYSGTPGGTFPPPRVDGFNGATATGGPVTGQPGNPAPGVTPSAWISLPSTLAVTVTVTITTAGGQTVSTQAITLNTSSAGDAQTLLLAGLPTDWVANTAGTGAIQILGIKKADGTIDPIASLTLTCTALGQAGFVTPLPQLTGVGVTTSRVTQ